MNETNWKKNITLFFTSQAISMFGSSLVQFAIVWFVAKETQSGIMVTFMTLCGFLPQVLISLFAGVWADRYNRKLMIIGADASIAVATFALAIIVMNTTEFYWALLVISAIRSVGAGIQAPAVNATIPQIVPQDKLMKISGINASVQSVINLVAPAVAGAVLSWGAIYYVMFVDIVTAAIGISILTIVPIAKHQKALEQIKGGYFDDLKAGVHYTLSNRFLRQLLTVSSIFCLLIVSPALLNVLFVTRIYGDNYLNLTLNEMSFFIGAVVGGIVIGAWGGFDNRLKTLGMGGIAFGVMSIAIGITHHFWLYLIIMVITGFAMPFNNSPLMVMIQEKVEPDMQGRVFSLLQIVTTLIMPIGMAIFGPLADVIPIQWLMIGSGMGLLIMTTLVFNWKSFYNAGMKAMPFAAEQE